MIIGIQDEILKLNQDGLLDILLRDMTTKSNIIWGTDAYSSLGEGYYKEDEIRADLITGDNSHIIRNRVRKDLEQQSERTKAHAEVFTPFWICKLMIDYIDKSWLGEGRLCIPEEEKDLDSGAVWEVVGDDDWQDYVNSRRMELTCGEAPYLVTRYDVSNGDTIPMSERTGVLDRKLAVVGRFTNDRSGWMKWALRALTSTYGYEFQGDNLLIARLNLLMTFSEYYEEKFKRKLLRKDLEKAAEVISWNMWQMDGLTDKVPYSYNGKAQIDFFDLLGDGTQNWEQGDMDRFYYCVVRKWGHNPKKNPIDINIHESKIRGEKMFDYIIGNPPYQEKSQGEKKADDSIYHFFMDEAYKLAYKVELITPARFLFDNGNTPSKWNKKMLNDEHFKVLYFEPLAEKVFHDVGFKGGVAIHYYDSTSKFTPIKLFTKHDELYSIAEKVDAHNDSSLTTIMYNQNRFNLSNLYSVYPEIAEMISSDGKEKRFTSGCITYPCFHNTSKADSDVKILGVMNNCRVYKYIDKKFIDERGSNLTGFKVVVPANNGNGDLGEVISNPLIEEPGTGYTQTFISVGCFASRKEAESCLKYLKSKFARILLGIVKVTQNGKKEMWQRIPLQDFSNSSDIDWSQSVSDIDKQLYKKYDLSNSEISFIEKKAIAME